MKLSSALLFTRTDASLMRVAWDKADKECFRFTIILSVEQINSTYKEILFYILLFFGQYF